MVVNKLAQFVIFLRTIWDILVEQTFFGKGEECKDMVVDKLVQFYIFLRTIWDILVGRTW